MVGARRCSWHDNKIFKLNLSYHSQSSLCLFSLTTWPYSAFFCLCNRPFTRFPSIKSTWVLFKPLSLTLTGSTSLGAWIGPGWPREPFAINRVIWRKNSMIRKSWILAWKQSCIHISCNLTAIECIACLHFKIFSCAISCGRSICWITTSSPGEK